jgi:hypothetical protein
MRKTFRACLLVLALSCPTLAGEIHNPIQQPPNTAQARAIEGEIPNPETTKGAMTDILLSLFQDMLPLF